jgi:hypothetical protein
LIQTKNPKTQIKINKIHPLTLCLQQDHKLKLPLKLHAAAAQVQAQAAAQSAAAAQIQAQAVASPSASMPPPAARPPANQVVLSPAAIQQLFSPQGEKISSLVKRIVTLTHGNFAAWLKALNGIAYHRRWDKSRLMNTNFTWDQVEEDDPISNQQRRDALSGC